MGEINHFLLIYDLLEQKLVELRRFGGDSNAAMEAYSETERAFKERDDSANFEIVLIGADSLATIKTTHGRYFRHDVGEPFVFTS